MLVVSRRIEFDAAHRVMEHESKCKFLHGHRYVVEASFTADTLDKQGRIIDFGVVKERLGGWIDANWDHTTILHLQDKALGDVLERMTGQKCYYLPYNPTAENMGRYLLQEVCPVLFKEAHIRCVKIRLWETPNCYAEAFTGEVA